MLALAARECKFCPGRSLGLNDHGGAEHPRHHPRRRPPTASPSTGTAGHHPRRDRRRGGDPLARACSTTSRRRRRCTGRCCSTPSTTGSLIMGETDRGPRRGLAPGRAGPAHRLPVLRGAARLRAPRPLGGARGRPDPAPRSSPACCDRCSSGPCGFLEREMDAGRHPPLRRPAPRDHRVRGGALVRVRRAPRRLAARARTPSAPASVGRRAGAHRRPVPPRPGAVTILPRLPIAR